MDCWIRFSPQRRGAELNNLDLGRNPAQIGDGEPLVCVMHQFLQSPARMGRGAGRRKSAGDIAIAPSRRIRARVCRGIGGGPRITADVATSSRGGHGVPYKREPLVLPAHLYAGRSAGVLPPIPPCGLMKSWWIMVMRNIGESSLFTPRADLKRSANSPFRRSCVLVLLTMENIHNPQVSDKFTLESGHLE